MKGVIGKKTKDRIWIFCSLFFFVTGVILFVFIPFAESVFLSFTRGISNPKIVGLKNYLSLLKNPAFHIGIKNSVRFALVAIPLNTILPLLIAVLIRQLRKLSKSLVFLICATIITPTFSLMTFFNLLFDTNGLFASRFLENNLSYYDTDFAFWILILLFFFKYSGYNILIYLIALSRIPKEFHEEAKICGANRFQTFFYICLPQILPAIVVALLLSIINSYKIYMEAYLIGGAYPHESIYTLQHFINNNFVNMNYTRLSCVCVLIVLSALCIASVVLVLLRAARSKI